MNYTRTWTVRFSDADPFGIAHYPQIVDAIHDTSDMFLETLGWSYWVMTEEHGFGLPLVSIDFEFEKPIRAGTEVEIELVPTVGETSVRYDFEATHEGAVAFAGTEHRVCVPVDGDEPVPVPDELRRAIEDAT